MAYPAARRVGTVVTDLWSVLIFIALWLTVGLVTAAWFVIRAGHSHPLWYVVGALLGPLFIPIAVERGRPDTRAVDVREGRPVPSSGSLRVLMGVDGSPDSDRALRAVARTLTGTTGNLITATVISPDLVGADAAEEVRAVRRFLDERINSLPAGLPEPATEVVVGRPADALLEIADEHEVDVLVVGRHGLRDRFMGSVANDLTRRSRRAVLLGALADE